jgi:hypothetical protein
VSRRLIWALFYIPARRREKPENNVEGSALVWERVVMAQACLEEGQVIYRKCGLLLAARGSAVG